MSADRFARFFSAGDGCWLWRGATSTNRRGQRYGRFRLDGRMVYAHRHAFERTGAAVTAQVLHRCDVPLCVNPAHLMHGTQKDNAVDAKAKGRLWTARDASGKFIPRETK